MRVLFYASECQVGKKGLAINQFVAVRRYSSFFFTGLVLECVQLFSLFFSLFFYFENERKTKCITERKTQTRWCSFFISFVFCSQIFFSLLFLLFLLLPVCVWSCFYFIKVFFFISFVVRTIRNSENQTLIFETVETKKNIYKITNKIQKKNSSKQQQYKPVNVLQWHYYHIQWKSIIHLVSAFLNNYIYCGVRSTTNQMHK